MSIELKQTIEELRVKLEQVKDYLDLPEKEKRLKEIEVLISKKNFWDNPEETKPVLKERALLTGKIDRFQTLINDLEESEILLDLAVEELDTETLEEVSEKIQSIEKRSNTFSLDLMLDGDDDRNNAIVSINAGAGGTEAQDWAEMLFRMYSRWVDRKSFKIDLIDFQPGDEAGIKSVTFTANGDYAYGYLKTETGVHRLVRISPFSASGKRHTSFASVFVYPELNSEIVIDVENKDLRIDVYRASGAGGQHVNKTSSAVRITHLPTSIVVQCQQEKSQFRNKEMAMKVLKARLYQHEKQKQDDKKQKMHDSKDDIAWGNQIRSYVLHPYQLVKDHRTSLEIGNVTQVLDGELDRFIKGVLFSEKS
ncbi:MAG: peptide chain release factor 2 [Desulfobacterales bacterium]|nr:peptide chain release factor 2 [Desulfobacterales bacterium]MDP6682750.1 peptide chain release factor 2 [Desulfobacterales bacterium]MDP6808087.1 peptide chain release factor 2 [Desulfobacterales bacterium]MDP7077502.1 peptide chain release factor 2 [Desulfobacterales bacterium]MDP7354907.1 peptide chain release factor 2 [Desulfobacterales bacterium]